MESLHAGGCSLRGIASQLNRLHQTTRTGKVKLVLGRAAMESGKPEVLI
jgi:hypothetical protein